MSLSGSTISAVGQGKQVLVWVAERSLRWGVRGGFCDYIPGLARILRDSLIQTDGSCLFVADQDGPVPVCNGSCSLRWGVRGMASCCTPGLVNKRPHLVARKHYLACLIEVN